MKKIFFVLLNVVAFSVVFAVTFNNFVPNFSVKEKLFKSKPATYAVSSAMSCVYPESKPPTLVPELWSDPATWGGVKPVAGQAVVISANKHIILDEDTPNLSGLTINGTLEFDRKNLNLTADWIMVMGLLQVGTTAAPFEQEATFNLTGTNVSENNMGMGTRGIMVMGGVLELHGTPPTKTWTKINNHAAQGSTSLSLVETVNWKVNDQIAVAPTDYLGTGDTQKVAINAISGNNLTISTAMNSHRWGLLQYATTTGMSLNPGPIPSTIVEGTPTVLDERAEVGNLSRNIVIQAPNDLLWQNNGFGCHVMIMRNGTMQGVAHVNGVEIRRGGQDGRVGRYPFHWHMLSYEGANTLNDATGQYIRNSSVHNSAHRGIVIHGTNGVEVSNNVIFDIRGHAIFTEDASERRNTIDGNLVLHIRNPITPLKVHESNNSFGASGLWVSNPDNIITNNTVAGSASLGFWFAFTTQAWGLSEAIPINPSRTLFGVFDGNTAHSNISGFHFDDVESDNLGNTRGFRYVSTTDGLEPQWPGANMRRHMLSRYTTYKNAGQGIWNRASIPDNDQVVSADNCDSFFAGAGDNGLIKRSLIVGNSLNYNMNGMERPTNYGANFPVALASYHSSFDLNDNFILNFPAKANTPSGAFRLDDYYLNPVDKGLVRNVNNTLINSHPGVRTAPYERTAPNIPKFTYGVLWDAHDYWGGSAAEDNYYVFDTPFLTYGQTPTIVQPNTATSGGVVVTGPFYGVQSFVINKANSRYNPRMGIQVNRLNAGMEIVGEFEIAEGFEGDLFAGMRHFSTHPTGIYDLNFPTLNNVNDFSIYITNMLTDSDYQVIGVEYDGNYNIDNLFSSTSWNYMDFGDTASMPESNTNNTHIYQAVNSFASVVSSPNGEVFWQDKINNKIWFKIRGGLNPGDVNQPANSEFNLMKGFNIRAYGTADVQNTTTWTSSWSNGTPDADKDAIIDGVYNTSTGGVQGPFTANRLVVTSTGSLTINSGTNLTVQNEVVNNGVLVLENNANLIQVNNNPNRGSIRVHRNSNSLYRSDYTLWSSPVVARPDFSQTLLSFSPLTQQTPTNRFYMYNPHFNIYSSFPAYYTFAPGVGYLIRMPNSGTPNYNLGTETATHNGVFTGVPYNGNLTLTLRRDTYHGLGNPYPSTIDADAFINANSLTEPLYFWRKTNNAASASYATYTLAGGTANAGGMSSIVPNGTIQVGQGFIARAASNPFVFTNAMRIGNNSNQILKTKKIEKNRIWLNLSKDNVPINQMMIAYLNGATNGIDSALDGRFFNDSAIALNSIINNEEFVIQAKGLPFDDNDVVPLTFKTNTDGNYTISIGQVEGLFAGNQDVYLNDKTTGVYHNLKNSQYQFTASAGTFNDRFELVYKNKSNLGINATEEESNKIIVYKQNGVLNVSSENKVLKTIRVFDSKGALIFEQERVNQTVTIVKGLPPIEQMLLVQITTKDEKIITKKLLF